MTSTEERLKEREEGLLLQRSSTMNQGNNLCRFLGIRKENFRDITNSTISSKVG